MAQDGARGWSRRAAATAVAAVVVLVAVVIGTRPGADEPSSDPDAGPSEAATAVAATPEETSRPAVDTGVLDVVVVDGATDATREEDTYVASVTYSVGRDTAQVSDEVRAALGEQWLLRGRDIIGDESRAVFERDDGTLLTVQIADVDGVTRVAAIVTAP